MNFIQRTCLAACLTLMGLAFTACGTGGTETSEPSATDSLDSLLTLADGGVVGDAGARHPCATCIQTSCGEQITALGNELKSLRTSAHNAFMCVRNNRCLSLFWADRDAGASAARDAVHACVAACDADAGLPTRDAARSAVHALLEGVDTCVDTSCATQCPWVALERDR